MTALALSPNPISRNDQERRIAAAIAAGRDVTSGFHVTRILHLEPHLSFYAQLTPTCHACTVVGDCLTPIVLDGDTVIFDLEAKVEAGDFVAVFFKSGGVVIKALLDQNPENTRLGMFNPGRTLRAKTADIARLGKVVGFLKPDGSERFGGRSPFAWVQMLTR